MNQNRKASTSDPAITGVAIEAHEVHTAYRISDLKGDEQYGRGAFVKLSAPNVERRTSDGRYFIGHDMGKEYIRPDWEGYAVICTASQAQLLKTTGLKVKIKKVNRTHPEGGSEGVFVIMEAVDG